jgi:[acyl-carrier-protein] S-malonyltransferase
VSAFLFSGQLSEYVGMGRDFFDADPSARKLFEKTSERCGVNLPKILFEGPEEALRDNRAAQPGVFLVSTLAARELERRGARPSAVTGYSLGNYAALVAAGAVSYDDALTVLLAVLEETGRLGIAGAMGAVIGLPEEAVEEACRGLRSGGRPVWIGNVNAATQIVVTGTVAGIDALLDRVGEKALKAVRLSMTWPIHSPLMEPVARALAPVVEACASVRPPRAPFYAPSSGARIGTAQEVRDLLAGQIALPSRWAEVLRKISGTGEREFREVGPGDTLCRMIRWTVRDARCVPAGTLSAIAALPGPR